MSDPSLDADLVAWGKVIRLETVGRRSRRPRIVTVGFVPTGGEALLVAASSASTGWAVNLRARGSCFVELDGARRPYTATELEADERATVVRELILKYGTPAERLGAGPAFRLDPAW